MKKNLLFLITIFILACSSGQDEFEELVIGKTDPIIGSWYNDCDCDWDNIRFYFYKNGTGKFEGYDDVSAGVDYSSPLFNWINTTTDNNFNFVNYNYEISNLDIGDGNEGETLIINATFSDNFNKLNMLDGTYIRE